MINSGREWDWIQELYYKEQIQHTQDYYWENGNKVMTKKFLLERGFCCNLKCRHCPYV